jgi:hypothetical protein
LPNASRGFSRRSTAHDEAPPLDCGGFAVTLCCLCHAHGIFRGAKPVKIGVPLCVECRDAGAARVAAAVEAPAVALDMGNDSSSQLARYATRLTIAQAPARALAAMKPAGSA